MTVQKLYELTRKKADPTKVFEIRLSDDELIAEVEFKKEGGRIVAYLIEEGSIRP